MKKENNNPKKSLNLLGANLEILRHSLAHIMAAAIKDLYPEAKFAIGPAIDNGFYYDIDFGEVKIADADLVKIEKRMKQIIKKSLEFVRSEIDIDIAIQEAKKNKQDYKWELLKDLKSKGEKKVSFYKLGNFEDLCRGPHLEKTSQVKPGTYKLTKLAGAYFRGDENNKMLTRIYGLGFETKEELNDYLEILKEAEKRDHRKLGRELDLFSISQKVGPGLVLWHPKLAKVREAIEEFWRKFHRQRGYDTVYTPHIGRAELWQTSGHLDFFKESMYSPMDIEGEEYFVKPMNCPFHVEIYKSRPRSWREFPFRWNELGTVYRYEKSGELSGMLRVRGFTQDDAHIICRPDQFKDEYREVLQFTIDMFEVFGFKREDIKAYIAVRDPKVNKYAGSDDIWNKAEQVVREVVAEYEIPNEVEEGGAKFYGPALDLKIKDALGREWQLTTIQLDFNLPEKFDMTYVGKNGTERPIMIHRALLGSLERFFAILIEHYGGAFPLWCAPVQVKLVAVGEKYIEYCQKLAKEFRARDIRVEVDISDETVGKKIRKAVNEKAPYMLVIGEKEINSENLHIRDRGSREVREIAKDRFFEEIIQKVKEKK